MADQNVLETEAPPVGEEIHLPDASLIPIINAVGAALSLVGLTTMLIFTWVGLAVFFVSLVLWVRDSRRGIDELPLEH